MAAVSARFEPLAARLRAEIESAGLKVGLERFGLILAGIACAAWAAVVVLLRPGPATALLILPACAAACALGGRMHLRRRRDARIALFREQLEGALRTLAGGVRVGLGIRQALVLTGELCREPAKSEFARVVGLSNLGVSTLDAIDQLAQRMATTETAVLARVIRVQSQTGGDLASVLEGLAGTIRDRRRLRRRVTTVTAQGRATAWLLGALPLVVGLFMLTQEELRAAMLFTAYGRVFLAGSLGLDALAIVSLLRLTQVDG
jgi:tight adherence protein B